MLQGIYACYVCLSMCMYACTLHAYVSVCAGVRVHVQYLTETIFIGILSYHFIRSLIVY